MDIVCFRPRPEANLNDTFIDWGIKWLLREVLGDSADFHNVYFEPLSRHKLPDHDLFVVFGTPWLWDQCTRSVKYHDLVTALSVSKAPKIALGLGACFPFGFKCSTVNKVLSSMPNLDNIFEAFSTITVRDRHAKRIFNLLKIKAKFLCCPAVFAKECIHPHFNKPTKDILFFYAPQCGLSAEVLNKNFVRHYVTLQANYARAFGTEVICITEDEARVASESGLDAKLLRSTEEVAQQITKAKSLLSGRVHGCMFAAGMPIPAALLPVDTRFLAYKYCGGRIIMTDKVTTINLKKLRLCRFNYEKEKKKWKNFLIRSLRAIGLYS